MKRGTLNQSEFFKAKNVVREEIAKGNVPEVKIKKDKDAFHIYVVRKGLNKNGGDFDDYIGYAKKEVSAHKKVEAIKELIVC